MRIYTISDTQMEILYEKITNTHMNIGLSSLHSDIWQFSKDVLDYVEYLMKETESEI